MRKNLFKHHSAPTDMTCTTASTPIASFTTTPNPYAKQTYNYTAAYTGVAILEFGFKAKLSSKTWHLDDVSIVDSNSSNSEMLTNGDFENGTLMGWQVQCTVSNACLGSGGTLSTSTCHTGMSCFEGGCEGSYDFLRQAFRAAAGHIYTLSFWLQSEGSIQQYVYVTII